MRDLGGRDSGGGPRTGKARERRAGVPTTLRRRIPDWVGGCRVARLGWSSTFPFGMGVRVLVSLVVAGVMLVGCSGDGDPVLDPTPTPTSRVTPEPTDKPTTPPTEDSTPDTDPTAELEAEITAFFKEYIDTVNKSWTSKKALERRRKMFANSCEVCLRGYKFTEKAHKEDLEFVGEYGEVLDVRLESSIKQQVTFSVDARSPAAKLVDQAGEMVQKFDEYELVQTVYQARRLDSEAWILIAGETL